MKITKIPSHYRKLKLGEIIRKGDLYKTPIGNIGYVHFTIGDKYAVELHNNTYYRRRHVSVPKKLNPVENKPNPIEKKPLVTFYYPMSKTPWNSKLRTVRVISSNGKYLVGLEIVGKKHFFKKFLTDGATEMKFVEFNPKALV